MAEKEKKEISVLQTFLPKPLSAEELEQMIKTTIQELGATSKKEMGPVIKAVQAKAAGRADGVLMAEPVYAGPIVGYFCLLGDPDGNPVEFSYGQPIDPRRLAARQQTAKDDPPVP